jgi:YVTN family beta-propeller protein
MKAAMFPLIQRIRDFFPRMRGGVLKTRHAVMLLAHVSATSSLDAAFSHFEARHCHPITHTPDGNLLLAVNAPEGRLSVFSTAPGMTLPRLIAEIPVGLEPVSVRARSNQEAWVVNEVSDSVCIVDLAQRKVVATLPVGDEPADVVFSNGSAFVSCSRENRIAVIDIATRAVVSSIPLEGNFPRTLAVSPDGSRLYAGFLLSGNNTTTLHFRDAPEPPAPTNPALPAAPLVALIVPDTDPRISYDVIDHDIAEIDTTTLTVLDYKEYIGTNILALDCAPNGQIWAGATEARNLIRFEPNLNGVFQESRVALITSTSTTLQDLNPQATNKVVPAELKNLTLAQPMAVLADADGAWIAAFGSDRIARLDNTGEIVQRIDLRSTYPETVRGPRGLARHPLSGRIAVFNKLSNTISILHPATASVIGEIPVASHNPIPPDQLTGRGFFNDSRTSGNGTVSCASCHFDADIDGIAWDLGDPGGNMQAVVGSAPSINNPQPVDRIMHPMKGPMVTQPLRGIKNAGPFHWRGDKVSIQEFNPTFQKLQAGLQLPGADMDKVAAYIESLCNHPNPNRLIDNSLPATLNGGNPTQGKVRFEQFAVCSKCHSGERGTNHIIDESALVLTRQPVKNSTLEHTYKKVHFRPGQPATLSGFGFTHDGTGHDIPRGHEYALDTFDYIPNAKADVMAFILCMDTGTKPAVGSTIRQPSATLESQALQGTIDLIAHAFINGEQRGFLYQPASGTYLPDNAGEAVLTPAQLAALASSLQFTAVPPGNGVLLSIDRDADGNLNRDTPPPKLTIDAFLQPQSLPERADWYIEASEDLETWFPESSESPIAGSRFFRLHRTW